MAEKVNLRDWLSDQEFAWRQKLKPARLVVETDFTAKDVNVVKRRWGIAASKLLKSGYTHAKFIKRFPALTLLALVGHASISYEEGKFWESFWIDVGLERDQDFETSLRHSLCDLLAKFGLAPFPDVHREHGSKYVMLLALHAGIPRHCLADLLDVINTHIAHGRPANGAALMAWLDEPGKAHRSDELDVPVRNFLKYGAEFAVDILDRIIEFVIASMDDPSLVDLELDSSTTGLPDVLLRELIGQVRDRPMKWDQKAGSGAGATKRPFLRYDVADDEIFIALPYPSTKGEEPWHVSLDGEVRDVYPTRQWGASTEASLSRSTINRPTREIVVTHSSSSSSAVLGVVDQTDPLLTFSEKGHWVPRRDALKDSAWIVYPDGHEPVDPTTGDPVEVQHRTSPAGWSGWCSAFVELDAVSALQLRHRGDLVGTERFVRKDARPRFDLDDPIPGVRSTDGRTVYTRRPEVILPASASDSPPSWRVRTRRLGSSTWIVDESWQAECVDVALDPFDDDEEPQLGLFEIVVTGPLGADSRLVVFLAEDLWVEFDTDIRVQRDGGLTPCTAEVAAHYLTVEPSGALQFDGSEIDRPIIVHGNEHVERLFVVPPCVEVRSGDVGSPAVWRVAAQLTCPEDLALDRFVAVRAPGAESGEFVFFDSSGNLVQTGSLSKSKSRDVFEARTQQFADTARVHGSGRLVARLKTATETIDVTVLSIQPKRLGSTVVLREDVLDFGELGGIEGLSAYVWCATAPWLPPHVLPVMHGEIKLPETLLDAGQLRCQLFIDDPWVVVEPPRRPSADVLRVEQGGWYEAGTETQNSISRFLAHAGSIPDHAGAAPESWAALAQLHADGHVNRVKSLVPALIEDPRTSLESLGNSSIPLQDKMAVLVLSELGNRNYSAEFTLNALHSDPWFGCMTELSDLSVLYHHRDELSDERTETIGYLADRGGPHLTQILRTGDLTAFSDACFDEAIFAMVNAPVAQLIQTVRDRALLPRPLLDRERRRVGCYEAFLQRYAWMDSGWSPNFATQLEFVQKPIQKASSLAFKAISARSNRLVGVDVGENPWALMSVQSLTLALLARLEACGRVNGTYLNKGLVANWSRMAELCPTMVSTDLLMAEALIVHALKGDLIGNDDDVSA